MGFNMVQTSTYTYRCDQCGHTESTYNGGEVELISKRWISVTHYHNKGGGLLEFEHHTLCSQRCFHLFAASPCLNGGGPI